MDPIKLQQIINKKPKDVVTADEWNEILTLLIEQANLFSDRLQGFQTTLKQLIDGKLENVEIEGNITSFGGRPPEDYTLDEELTEAINTLTNYVDTGLNNKLTKPNLDVGKVLVSGLDKGITTCELKADNLVKTINGLPTTYLGINAKAKDAEKIEGKKITVSQTEPQNPAVGDVWISW